MLGIGIGVAVAVAAGGTAYVAKDAEPGDMLYNVRASLYGDVTADGDVETHLEGARAAHDAAADLEASGRLTAAERARLTTEYSGHVNAIAARIAELEAQGDLEAAADVRTNLRSTLRDYRDVFPTIEVEIEGSAEVDADASMDSDSSSSSSDDSMTESSASQGAASSIFVQPSSSVTSA